MTKQPERFCIKCGLPEREAERKAKRKGKR
jgi:hypothetical protein